MPVKMTVKGLEKTKRKLEQTAKDQRGEHMVKAYRSATLILVRNLKILSPVDTGRLRSSWTGQVSKRRGRTRGLRGVAGTNVKYAPYMNFGTGTFAGKKRHVVSAEHVRQWARRHKANPYAVALAITRRGGLRPLRFIEKTIASKTDDVIKIIENTVSKSTTK